MNEKKDAGKGAGGMPPNLNGFVRQQIQNLYCAAALRGLKIIFDYS